MTNVEMNMHRSTRFVILSEQSEAKDDKWRGSAYSLSRGDTPGWPLLPFGQFTFRWPARAKRGNSGSEEEFGQKSESQHNSTDLHQCHHEDGTPVEVFGFQVVKGYLPHSSSDPFGATFPPGEGIWAHSRQKKA